MTRPFRLALALPFLLPLPLAAQELSPEALGELTSLDGLGAAADRIAQAAEDPILIRDLLGQEIAGADGTAIGTIEDMAVIPGGRIVAAIVTVDGTRIAIPYAALKLDTAADVAAEVGFTADELKGSEALTSLANTLGE